LQKNPKKLNVGAVVLSIAYLFKGEGKAGRKCPLALNIHHFGRWTLNHEEMKSDPKQECTS